MWPAGTTKGETKSHLLCCLPQLILPALYVNVSVVPFSCPLLMQLRPQFGAVFCPAGGNYFIADFVGLLAGERAVFPA